LPIALTVPVTGTHRRPADVDFTSVSRDSTKRARRGYLGTGTTGADPERGLTEVGLIDEESRGTVPFSFKFAMYTMYPP
jgi:hypothetical protein